MAPSGSWPSNSNLNQFNITSNNNHNNTNNSSLGNNYNIHDQEGTTGSRLTMEDHDVIGSLGKALSGVNLASNDSTGGHGRNQGQGGGYEGYGSAPGGGGFDGSQVHGRGSFVNINGGSWNGLNSTASTPSGLSYGFYDSSNTNQAHPPPLQTSNSNTEHDSLQNVLYDSGIYEKDELHSSHHHQNNLHTHHRHSMNDRKSCTPPPSFESRERKQSIDIFLSQSPSKALGEDAFRVMGMHNRPGSNNIHRTVSHPAIVDLYHPSNEHGGFAGAGGGGASIGGGELPKIKPLSSTAPSSRSESPQPMRPAGQLGGSPYSTGGASAGVVSGSAAGQQLFPGQFNRMGSIGSIPGSDNGNIYSSSDGNNGQSYGGGYNNMQRNQQQLQQRFHQSQFTNSSSMASQQQQQQQPDQLHNQHHHQNHQHNLQQQQQQPSQQHSTQQQFVPLPMQQQQQQVFYMAVPAPDGKGQVLQPVQMVQIPGQPPTLMVPAVGAQGGQMTQGIVSPSNGHQTMNGVQGQGGVMLMNAMPGNNIMGNASMYAPDGSNNCNSGSAPFSPYGNDAQQSNNFAFSSKNNGGMDSMGGGNGQYQADNGMMDPNGVSATDNGNTITNNPNSLSMLYSSPQRPPLRALLGNVRRLSRDQVGCRLLQQALDEDGPAAATAILNEGLTFWAEAMVDPFGNYLFQKILERITSEERVTLVKSVSTRLVNASLNLHGTRSVQKIVEVCAIDQEEIDDAEGLSTDGDASKVEGKADGSKTGDSSPSEMRNSKKKPETAAKLLTDALKPSAARLCIDSHGNHAIQRILLKLPYQYTQFIFDAVAASVEDVARHRHGCCVIQRCLDSRHSAARTHLVARIVEKSLELMQDAYGNYVVQYVLDVCGDDEVHAICESVIGKVCLLAIQKFSSNVMEKCLERCTDRVREEYLNELNDSDRLRELMMDPFGNYVVQRALSVSTHAQAIRLVETMKPHLSTMNGGGGIRNTAGGRRILGKICRRFPNFALEGETFEDYNEINQVLSRNASPHHQQGRGRGHNHGYGGVPHHPHQPGPSPNHRRGRNRNPHIPAYNNHQGGGHHVNVVQSGGGGMMPQGVYQQHHQHSGNDQAYNMFPQSY